VQGKPLQIRYNSRLSIVIYAPKGYEIRYRIWSAPEKLESSRVRATLTAAQDWL